jgi:hypothetical protein
LWTVTASPCPKPTPLALSKVSDCPNHSPHCSANRVVNHRRPRPRPRSGPLPSFSSFSPSRDEARTAFAFARSVERGPTRDWSGPCRRSLYCADHVGEASYFNYETEDGKIIEDVAWCVNLDSAHSKPRFYNLRQLLCPHLVLTLPRVFRAHHLACRPRPAYPRLRLSPPPAWSSSINERQLR